MCACVCWVCDGITVSELDQLGVSVGSVKRSGM